MDPAVRNMTPAQRITKGFCPECGESLEGVNAQAHARAHWPHLDESEPTHEEALKRHRMLMEYHKATTAPANR